MPRQFWNEEQTKKSRELLNTLSGAVDFVLIGGWAVFMYSKQQMSLDMDIAIRYDALDYFRKYGIEDYKGTNIKYSIINGIYTDLFIEDFSDKDLPLPVEAILSNYTVIEGIKVVNKELLLLLKLHGYFRTDPEKVRKDILDVISLLLYGNIDLKNFKHYVKEYNIPLNKSVNVLIEYIDKRPQVQDFVDMSTKDMEKKLGDYKSQLKSLFGT